MNIAIGRYDLGKGGPMVWRGFSCEQSWWLVHPEVVVWMVGGLDQVTDLFPGVDCTTLEPSVLPASCDEQARLWMLALPRELWVQVG